MAVALIFFCPRFYLWRALGFEQGGTYPEVSRAQVVLAQLRNPYVIVLGESHQVTQWRLFFPALGHLLRLPPKVFLALPWLGAWICLGWVFACARSRIGSGWGAASVTLLMATLSWFFVSSGWLSYNDGWLALALCLYAFSPSQLVRVAVCLIIPWVDERFVFELPLLAALRHLWLGREPTQWRATAREVAFELLALSPYVLPRLYFLAVGADAAGRAHIARHLADRDPRQILRGLWEGLRLGWVAMLLGAAAVRARMRSVAVVAGLGAVALAANVLLAHDISRVTSVLAPLVLAACFALAPAYGGRGLWAVACLAAGNLLLPASDVIEGSGGGPISPVWREWGNSRRMSQAMADAAGGNRAYRAGDYPEAVRLLSAALASEGGFVDARRGLAWSYFYQGQFAPALREAAVVTESVEARPEDWLLRGLCEAKANRAEDARRSLGRVLEKGRPVDIHVREVAEKVLSGLTGAQQQSQSPR
jgi:hypothetical protein